MHIIRLTPADQPLLHTVARLHAENIQHGILPLLGIHFMESLYRGLAGGPYMGVWVAVEHNRVLGFLAGSADVRRAYANVVRREGLRLAVWMSRALLSPRVLRRLPALLTYLAGPSDPTERPQQPGGGNGRAELLAMAVAPAAQRTGVGKALVDTLERVFHEWGCCSEYYVTTNLADPRSNSFYLRLGFKPVAIMRHHVLRLQVYRKNLNYQPQVSTYPSQA